MTEQASEFLPSSWKVFIDGVEVPHQGLTVSFGEGSASTAVVILEPDRELYKLRPQSLVHLFARDRFATPLSDPEADFLDNYYLYWEGISVAVNHQKGATSRSMEITASSLLSILENTKAFSIGIGAGVHSAILEGSALNPILANTSDTGGFGGVDIFSAQFLTDAFANVSTVSSTGAPAVSSTFVDRVIQALTFLGSYNSLLRQQMVRSRLLDKLSSIPDNTLGGLLSVGLLKSVAANLSNTLHQESSVLDIVKYLLSIGFYRIYGVPFPATLARESRAAAAYPVPEAVSEIVARKNAEFPRGTARNDILLLPDTSYALPPPCNLIFPEMISGLSFSRSYEREPTRYMLEDPFLLQTLGESIVSFLAPSSIIRAAVDRKTLTPDKLMGVALELIQEAEDTAIQPSTLLPGQFGPPTDPASTSAYMSNGVNLLNLTSDLELEKGIVLERGIQSMAVLAAAVAGSGMTETTGATDEQTTADVLTKATDKSTSQGKYAAYMANITQYLFQKSKQSRSLNLVLQGHRWLVPGFPCIVFDDTISYLGHIHSVSFQVSDTGQEMSSVALSYARAVPDISASTVRSLLTGVSEAGNAVDSAAAEVSAAFNVKMARLTEASATVRRFEDTLRLTISRSSLPANTDGNLIGSALQLLPNDRALEQLSLAARKAITATKDLMVEAKFLIKDQEGATQVRSKGDTAPSRANLLNKAILYEPTDKTSKTQLRRYFGTTALSTSPPKEDIPGITQDVYHANYLLQETEHIRNWLLGTKFLIKGDPLKLETGPHELGDKKLNYAISANKLLLRFSASATTLASKNTAKSILTVVEDWSKFISSAVTWMQDVYKQQQAALTTTGVAPALLDSSLQASVSGFTEAVKQEDAVLSAFLATFEDANDWAVPPDSFNKSFLDLTQLDALYGSVLGCKPLYTSTELGAVLPKATKIGADADPLTPRGKAAGIISYLQGLTILDSIYPIFRDSTLSTTSSALSYATQAALAGPRTGLFEWEERTFLRRAGTTLRQFSESNTLALKMNSIKDGVFLTLSPLSPGMKIAGAAGSLLWDDTIFSKIVDDSQLFNPPRAADPLIAELRKTVAMPELTTAVRQAQIRSYSERHFSARGFGGK